MKKIWKWLDNFWYHNKWKTIIIAFFLIVFIIGFVQCMQKTDADVSILYVGPEVVTGEEYDAMEKSLESRIDTDYNGDGKITAFDAQILAEANAGNRVLNDQQSQKAKGLSAERILDWILSLFGR